MVPPEAKLLDYEVRQFLLVQLKMKLSIFRFRGNYALSYPALEGTSLRVKHGATLLASRLETTSHLDFGNVSHTLVDSSATPSPSIHLHHSVLLYCIHRSL